MAATESDFRIVSKLGEGSFAEVYKVRSNRDGNFYAVKRLKKRYRSIEEVNRLPEVLYLKQLQGHLNVIEFKDLIYDQKNGYVAIVFELMDCNLYEFLSDHKKPFEEDVSLLLIYQLLQAVSFLHSKNMFHRDIKPENCMVNKDTYLLKLCDFGSTRAVSSLAPYTEYVSTRWYRAPECILTSGSYGPEVDEWAAGCMLFELLTGKPLFPGRHEIDQICRIHNLLGTPSKDILAEYRRNPNQTINFQFQKRPAQDLHKFLPNTSSDTIDLLMKLLTYSPADRLSALDALQHPAFTMLNHYYEEWQKNISSSSSMPFPAYYMQTVHGVKYTPNQFSTSSSTVVQPNPTLQPISVDLQKKPVQPTQNPTYIPQPPSIKPTNKPMNPLTKSKCQVNKPLNPSTNLNKPSYHPEQPSIPQVSNQPSYKPKPPNIESTIMAARIKAAQRLKEYEKKMKSNYSSGAPIKKPPQGLVVGPYKPPNYNLNATQKNLKPQQVFQMPKPEILKPRLPPQYKMNERKGQYSHLPNINP